MATQQPQKATDVEVSVIDREEDFAGVFDVSANAFGHQIHDAIWIAITPRWDTPEGRKEGIARFVARWKATTKNKDGQPNTVFLKATVPDPQDPSRRVIAGVATWVQLSVIPGYGDEPSADISKSVDLEAFFPGNEPEQRFLKQLWASLVSRRVSTVKEKATADPPATFHLDLCAVDTAFQRRGIALKLVQWGLDEAKRRGGLESATEASVMGRHAYKRIGFKPVVEIPYEVDEEFKDRVLPSNLFMRTGDGN